MYGSPMGIWGDQFPIETTWKFYIRTAQEFQEWSTTHDIDGHKSILDPSVSSGLSKIMFSYPTAKLEWNGPNSISAEPVQPEMTLQANK